MKRRISARKSRTKKAKKHHVKLFKTLAQAHEAYMEERALRFDREQEVAALRAERQVQEVFTWLTRDGERLRPCDMEESHLRNTISYLQRTLVYSFGNARFLAPLDYKVQALHEMLKEAKRRSVDI